MNILIVMEIEIVGVFFHSPMRLSAWCGESLVRVFPRIPYFYMFHICYYLFLMHVELHASSSHILCIYNRPVVSRKLGTHYKFSH